MIKCTWLTDIHLNFLEHEERLKFYKQIANTNAEAVFISGDIAEATSIIEILKEMARYIAANIYFVAGNHDYYLGDIASVRIELEKLTRENDKLFWLASCDSILLRQGVVLIGQDGWADGRIGDYASSRVVINDSRLIDDLFQQKILGKYKLLEKMQALADQDAKFLKLSLDQTAIINPQKIVVLTHIPPFKEACLHHGEISNDDWLPFFSSKVIGDVLTNFAMENTQIALLVLCGHTHSEALYQPLPNLVVRAGKSEYYMPQISDVIDI